MMEKVKDEYVSLAQNGVFNLKEAVFNLLKDNPQGLRGSKVGQLLGIHKGFTDGGQTGWIARIILERLHEDGKVTRDHTKKWFAINDR